MSTTATPLNTIQDVQNQVKNCAGAIATMAASIRAELEAGRITGFTSSSWIRGHMRSRRFLTQCGWGRSPPVPDGI